MSELQHEPVRFSDRAYGLEDSRQAMRLISAAVNPLISTRAALGGEGDELVQRYSNDRPFRDLVEAIAAGAGMQVIGVSDQEELVLAVAPQSAKDMRVKSFMPPLMHDGKRRMDNRGIEALVLIGIVAGFFPSRAAVEEAKGGHLVATQTTGALAEQILAMCRNVLETEDEPHITQRTRRAAHYVANNLPMWVVDERRGDGTPKDHRRERSSLMGVVNRVLRGLLECRLLVHRGLDGAEGDEWTTTRSFHFHIYRFALRSSHARLIDLAKNQETV